MRCDQYIGLTEEAEIFLILKENEIPEEKCPHCGNTRDLEVIGCYSGMFGDKYMLYRHILKDGGYADECLQAAPWNSGPMFFISLKVTNKNKEKITFEWSEEEINSY